MTSTPFAFYAVKQSGDRWLAWGALERLTENTPVLEAVEPVYFSFGSSEDAAVESLHREIEEKHGKRRWWRHGVLNPVS